MEIGCPKVAVVIVHHRSGSTPAGRLFLLLIVVVGFSGKLLILGSFNAHEVGCVRETTPRGTFVHELLKFTHVSGMVQCDTQMTRWRSGQVSSVPDLVLTRTRYDMGSLELEQLISGIDQGAIRMQLSMQVLVAHDKYGRNFSGIDRSSLPDLGLRNQRVVERYGKYVDCQ